MSQKTISNNKGGVKSDAGKAISKYNAQKHMILRETVSEYENTKAEELYEDLSKDLKPVGRLQESIVEIIALNMIKLARLVKSESEIIKFNLSPMVNETPDVCFNKKSYQPKLCYASEQFGLFSRYQTAIENRIYRATATLKKLQGYE